MKLLYLVTNNLATLPQKEFPEHSNCIIVCPKDTVIDASLKDQPVIISTNGVQDQLCSALLAWDDIDSTEPLLIVHQDFKELAALPQMIKHFENNQYDAGVALYSLSTKDSHNDRQYVLLNKDLVCEVSIENPISSFVLKPVYWYNSGQDFLQAAQNILYKDIHNNHKFYLSSVINELILKNKKVGIFPSGRQ